MIKVIGTDLNGVLVKDTFKEIKRKYWRKNIPEKTQKEFRRIMIAANTGQATGNELIKAFQEVIVPRWSDTQMRKHIFATYLLPPWYLLEKLRTNYPVAILTNNYQTGPKITAKLLNIDLSPYTIINSAVIGMMKPDLVFYRAVLKRLKIRPEEMLFIDDTLPNVIAAKKIGIKAFHYDKNMPQLRAFLKKCGISGL